MECKFFVGQKVVCVNDRLKAFLKPGVNPLGITLDLDGLTAGKVYTISGLTPSNSKYYTSEIIVELKEIKRPGRVQGFDFRRFRPLEEIRDELKITTKQKTDISIFQKMCERKYTEKEISELLTEDA